MLQVVVVVVMVHEPGCECALCAAAEAWATIVWLRSLRGESAPSEEGREEFVRLFFDPDADEAFDRFVEGLFEGE